MDQTIGFIGGGNMACSLIGGLINGGVVNAKQIYVFEPNSEKCNELKSQFGIRIAQSNEQLIEQCSVVVIAVKPQILRAVLSPLASSFKEKSPLIVSIVAGITASSIEQWLEGQYAIVRVMPNTPALVGQGASGLYANSNVSEEQRSASTQLMNAVGASAWVAKESDIDSITALSGSGPAYFMLFIQSLIESAIKAGLEPDAAKELAVKTASGTAALIESSDLPLQTLIDNVTSPGGTTEQALLSFARSDLKSVVASAFNAAKNRSEELAKELG